MNSKSFNRIIFSALILLLVSIVSNRAQFFTKSTKSIPRMGRRSDDSINSSNSLLTRRTIIDKLIDQVGPTSLLAALKLKGAESSRSKAGQNNLEFAIKNDQPFENGLSPNFNYNDWLDLAMEPNNYYLYSVSIPENGGAEEYQGQQLSNMNSLMRRSGSFKQQQPRDGTGNSLAMRALQAERFMRHLASGEPLMPLDKVLGGAGGLSVVGGGGKQRLPSGNNNQQQGDGEQRALLD